MGVLLEEAEMFWYYVLCVVGLLACLVLCIVALLATRKQGKKSVLEVMIACYLGVAAIMCFLMNVTDALECNAVKVYDLALAMTLDEFYATWRAVAVAAILLAGVITIVSWAAKPYRNLEG